MVAGRARIPQKLGAFFPEWWGGGPISPPAAQGGCGMNHLYE